MFMVDKQCQDLGDSDEQTLERLHGFESDLRKVVESDRKKGLSSAVDLLTSIGIFTSDCLRRVAKISTDSRTQIYMQFAGLWKSKEKEDDDVRKQTEALADQGQSLPAIRTSGHKKHALLETQDESAERRARERIGRAARKKKRKRDRDRW